MVDEHKVSDGQAIDGIVKDKSADPSRTVWTAWYADKSQYNVATLKNMKDTVSMLGDMMKWNVNSHLRGSSIQFVFLVQYSGISIQRGLYENWSSSPVSVLLSRGRQRCGEAAGSTECDICSAPYLCYW